ncbi:uncharacterized protein G2W53_005225 [Senna tora]|uniref:Uncharacterized protein n=1 Tax=Senna tora TaxID=362788 RepID=A0A835CL04_9FABA|nr:uncharacterized protein G2W53_005225 [Senna tora]
MDYNRAGCGPSSHHLSDPQAQTKLKKH